MTAPDTLIGEMLALGRRRLAALRADRDRAAALADEQRARQACAHWLALCAAVKQVVPGELLPFANLAGPPADFRGTPDDRPENGTNCFALEITLPGFAPVVSLWCWRTSQMGGWSWGMAPCRGPEQPPRRHLWYVPAHVLLGNASGALEVQRTAQQVAGADDVWTALAVAEEEGQRLAELARQAEQRNALAAARQHEAEAEEARLKCAPAQRLLDALANWFAWQRELEQGGGP